MISNFQDAVNFELKFRERLPRDTVPPSKNPIQSSKLTLGVQKYAASKQSNVICPSIEVKQSYSFSANHTGRHVLAKMISLVNSRELFQVGNFFQFHLQSESMPDIGLLANPTRRQPGNGVITAYSGDCQPRSWDYLMSRLSNKNTKRFTSFFTAFMTTTLYQKCDVGVQAQDLAIFTEIAFLLLFEVARRMVQEVDVKPLKSQLDSVPVASCIALCLSPNVNDIRKCRGVFGYRQHRNYPNPKIAKRMEAAEEIYNSFEDGSDYKELLHQLFVDDSNCVDHRLEGNSYDIKTVDVETSNGPHHGYLANCVYVTSKFGQLGIHS